MAEKSITARCRASESSLGCGRPWPLHKTATVLEPCTVVVVMPGILKMLSVDVVELFSCSEYSVLFTFGCQLYAMCYLLDAIQHLIYVTCSQKQASACKCWTLMGHSLRTAFATRCYETIDMHGCSSCLRTCAVHVNHWGCLLGS